MGKHGRDIDEKDTYIWQCEMKNIKILTVITYRLHILNAINFVSLYFLFLNHDINIIEIRYFKYCSVFRRNRIHIIEEFPIMNHRLG